MVLKGRDFELRLCSNSAVSGAALVRVSKPPIKTLTALNLALGPEKEGLRRSSAMKNSSRSAADPRPAIETLVRFLDGQKEPPRLSVCESGQGRPRGHIRVC